MSEIADHGPTAASLNADRILERATKKLPRRRFFSDMPDKGLFGLVSIAGFAVILVLKVHGFNPDVIAALAVGLMLVYGFIAYQMPLVQMRLDRLGDNFYYLGFIFTLASLSAALWQLREGTQVDQLLGSFGIALVTTIVGIAGRVLFAQLRSELDDVEERLRRDLAATSSELRGQLASSIADFEVFRTSLLQTLQETAKGCEEACKAQIAQIDGLARSATERIDGALLDNSRHTRDLTVSLGAVAQSANQVSQRISSMKMPSEELEREVAVFAQGLRTTLADLGSIVEELAQRTTRRKRWYWPF